MLKSLIYIFFSSSLIINSLPIQNILNFEFNFSNILIYDFGTLSFELIEATKISIDKSRPNNPKIYTNGSIKVALDSSKIIVGGFIFDSNKVIGNENIYSLDVAAKGTHQFQIKPIDNYGSIVNGTLEIILDDPKINVTNENNSVSKNIVKSPYSNNVVNTFFSSSNCLIKFNDAKISQVNLYNVDDEFLNPKDKKIIDTNYGINANGNYMIIVDNIDKEQFVYFVRVGEWTTANIYQFNNFWDTKEGKDLKAKANYHSPEFYNNEWFDNATTAEINFLLSISQNWPLPPEINNNTIAIIIGSVFGIISAAGLSVGAYFLSKFYHKKKKEKNNRERDLIIKNKLKKEKSNLESIEESRDATN